ncbi:hypothetical protein HUN41_00200 [Streptomyces phage Coruscant]|uniref:Uncharacterized protein n=1 Tax=Streptomyces phage Coruscant TaxID=2739834 RepID=A0A7G4AWA3_9CAUD|nr:hypothetical protein PP454_gp124 [Streptomyces phage Coruscant]QMP84293.1 hypothetical protein HUN41_00200 [Streptomyces phage Coruscant]
MNGYVLKYKTGEFVFFASNGLPYGTNDLQKMHIFTDLNEAFRVANRPQNNMTVHFVQLSADLTQIR